LRRRPEARLVTEIERSRALEPRPIAEGDARLPEPIDEGLPLADVPTYAPAVRAGAGVFGRPGVWPAGPEPGRARDSWAGAPGAADAGLWASFRRAVTARPIRADRTHALEGERGGRVDRLDLWVVIVLVVAAMALRTFRL